MAEAAGCQLFEATHSCQTISFTPIPEPEPLHTRVERRSVGLADLEGSWGSVLVWCRTARGKSVVDRRGLCGRG